MLKISLIQYHTVESEAHIKSWFWFVKNNERIKLFGYSNIRKAEAEEHILIENEQAAIIPVWMRELAQKHILNDWPFQPFTGTLNPGI